MTLDINYTTTNPRKVDQILESKINEISVKGSAIPFVLPSSGNITSTSGGITATTAFDVAPGPSFTFLPMAALNPTSSAGWYYTVWSSTTVGIVYAVQYQAGIPEFPVTPTPLTTTVAAYTQAISTDIFGPTYLVEADSMGLNGTIEWWRSFTSNNSGTSKSITVYMSSNYLGGVGQTTNTKAAGYGTIRNRGTALKQIMADSATGDSGNASSFSRTSINTGVDNLFSFCLKTVAVTDYIVLESHGLRVSKI